MENSRRQETVLRIIDDRGYFAWNPHTHIAYDKSAWGLVKSGQIVETDPPEGVHIPEPRKYMVRA